MDGLLTRTEGSDKGAQGGRHCAQQLLLVRRRRRASRTRKRSWRGMGEQDRWAAALEKILCDGFAGKVFSRHHVSALVDDSERALAQLPPDRVVLL